MLRQDQFLVWRIKVLEEHLEEVKHPRVLVSPETRLFRKGSKSRSYQPRALGILVLSICRLIYPVYPALSYSCYWGCNFAKEWSRLSTLFPLQLSLPVLCSFLSAAGAALLNSLQRPVGLQSTLSWLLSLFSSSVMSDSLWPHGLQHASLSCPSLYPGACSNSSPWSQWCRPTISSCHPPFPPALNLELIIDSNLSLAPQAPWVSKTVNKS